MKTYSMLVLMLSITSFNGQDSSYLPDKKAAEVKTISEEEHQLNASWTDIVYLWATGKTTSDGPNNFVRQILQDKAGNFWFATWEGIYQYEDPQKNKVGLKKSMTFKQPGFTNFTETQDLKSDPVFCMLEDRKGNLWFGTRNFGAWCYNARMKDATENGKRQTSGQTRFSNFTKIDGLRDNFVYSILEDQSGNIWFGTNNGVSRYDGKSFTNYSTKDGLSHPVVYTITEDKSGKLWFGTQGGVCFFNGKTFTAFKNKSGSAFRNVRSILEDKSGNLWIGSPDGVSCYDGHSIRNFTTRDGLTKEFVWSILEDKKGNLWFGVCDEIGNGGGLCRYDGKVFTNFTEKDGLAGNRVLNLIEDKSGNIWFGTDKGVGLYDGKMFLNISGQGNGC